MFVEGGRLFRGEILAQWPVQAWGPHIASHSVCPSVWPSVPLLLPSVTSNYNDTHVLFGKGRISYGHLVRTNSCYLIAMQRVVSIGSAFHCISFKSDDPSRDNCARWNNPMGQNPEGCPHTKLSILNNNATSVNMNDICVG